VVNMKFIADNMLAKLAKYLRATGYNCIYPPPRKLQEIKRLTENESRIFLTRNKKYNKLLPQEKLHIIQSDNFSQQFREIFSKFNLELREEKMFSLCLLCNEPVKPVDKEEIKEQLPEMTIKLYSEFYICPKCHRIYWYGGHTKRMKEKINSIIAHK